MERWWSSAGVLTINKLKECRQHGVHVAAGLRQHVAAASQCVKLLVRVIYTCNMLQFFGQHHSSTAEGAVCSAEAYVWVMLTAAPPQLHAVLPAQPQPLGVNLSTCIKNYTPSICSVVTGNQ